MSGQRWYPSKKQLSTPDELERAMREMLRLHYTLADQVKTAQSAPAAIPAKGGSAPDNPATTILCGIPVVPVDTNSLADGATLKYVKSQGVFKFS